MKIMIIDDEEDICFILALELQCLGHEIVTFKSTNEASEYLLTDKVDAILCDLKMPGMNGLEFLNHLRKHDLKIPFYLLTGEALADTGQFLAHGVKDVLYKPQDLLKLSDLFK